MVWDSAAYTIHTLEETQRNANRALLTSLSARQRDCLAALVKFAAYVPLCVKKKQVSSNLQRYEKTVGLIIIIIFLLLIAFPAFES